VRRIGAETCARASLLDRVRIARISGRAAAYPRCSSCWISWQRARHWSQIDRTTGKRGAPPGWGTASGATNRSTSARFLPQKLQLALEVSCDTRRSPPATSPASCLSLSRPRRVASPVQCSQMNTPGPAIRWSTSSPLRAQKTRRAPLGGAGGGEPRIRHRARPASERRLLRPPAPADPHLDLPNRVRAGRACPDAQPSTTTTVRASGAMMARLVAAQAHASCKANECSQIGVHGTGLFRRARGGAPVTALPKDGPPTPAPPAASNEPTAPPPPEPVRIPMEDVSELDHRYQGRRADKPAEKRPSSRRGRPE
jgi:hypothetical protein